jgi:hypothetical protein
VFTTSLIRRALVLAVSAACLFPVAAFANGDSPADHQGVKIAATKPADPQLVRGDSPSEYAAVTGASRTRVGAPVVQGDRPSDYAAVTGAPRTATVPIEIVRPERTIVRDRVPAAPVVLAGLALVVALIGVVDLRARRRTLQARVH